MSLSYFKYFPLRRIKKRDKSCLKSIKKRIDAVAADGLITEKDTFNLCIRMAEGHLTQAQVDESLVPETITDEQFAAKLKEFSQQEESNKLQQKQKNDKQISELTSQIEQKDGQIQNLSERIQSLEEKEYQRQKNKYVDDQIDQLKRDTWINVIIVGVVIALCFVNEYYKQVLPTIVSVIIAVLATLATTFVTSWLRETSIKDYFCRKGLRERLAKQYDETHKEK